MGVLITTKMCDLFYLFLFCPLFPLFSILLSINHYRLTESWMWKWLGDFWLKCFHFMHELQREAAMGENCLNPITVKLQLEAKFPGSKFSFVDYIFYFLLWASVFEEKNASGSWSSGFIHWLLSSDQLQAWAYFYGIPHCISEEVNTWHMCYGSLTHPQKTALLDHDTGEAWYTLRRHHNMMFFLDLHY